MYRIIIHDIENTTQEATLKDQQGRTRLVEMQLLKLFFEISAKFMVEESLLCVTLNVSQRRLKFVYYCIVNIHTYLSYNIYLAFSKNTA